MALGKTEVIRGTSFDGPPVEGILVLPQTIPAGARVPLIVQIHGGQASAVTQSFISGYGNYSHVFAAAGYACLLPNYRGSTNYGDQFKSAISGEYFRLGYEDILSGVDALIARGIVDSAQMGVMGWSAGGHWSNWILTHTDRFKGAISSGAGAGPVHRLVAIWRRQDDAHPRGGIGRLAARGIPSHFSVSHTTRARRPAENEGIDYHFVDRAAFEGMVQRGQFLEWAEYNGHLYGTARAEVEPRLADGWDVFLDIVVQGATQVKTAVPDVVKVFVYPPSYDVLKQRLTARRQDAPEAIRQRLRWALRELGVAGEFDYAIINDRLDEAVDELLGICTAEHQRPKRMKSRLDAIRASYQRALEGDSP